jgi:hypothetical protein
MVILVFQVHQQLVDVLIDKIKKKFFFFSSKFFLPELAGEFKLADFFLLKPSVKQVDFVKQSISSVIIELLLLDVRRFDCLVSFKLFCINDIKSKRCFGIKR